MEEKFLYHIWDEGHLNPELKTAGGKSLRIIYPGQYNTNRGPDFCNAIISIDGNAIGGDIEIHLNTYDWIAHSHHEDHFFNNTVLHVVLEHRQNSHLTIKENGETIEILELKNQLSEDIDKLLARQRPGEKPASISYCDLLSAVDADTLSSILGYYGMRRFRSKVKRFNASLILSDFDQVLYEGMMEAVGYDKNKLNLLKIAQLIPYRLIREWHQQGMDALDLISIICVSSGLLEKSQKLVDEGFAALLRQRFEAQGFFAQRLDIPWQLFRIRPTSHPIYRIIALCSLILKTTDSGLINYFISHVRDFSLKEGDWYRGFNAIFAKNVLPGAEKFPKPGKGVIGNIYLNIFLPVVHLYHEKISDTKNLSRILDEYQSFPALQDNHITRFMANHTNPNLIKLALGKSIHQQGLIDIYYRFCRYRLCDECVTNARDT
ncbi:MAG: DUF2851 family protein [Candidatus Cloacimonadaceae bacterium]|nr:DUF2851 family protein [Candidatus Cloacimonadaceae bacterium]